MHYATYTNFAWVCMIALFVSVYVHSDKSLIYFNLKFHSDSSVCDVNRLYIYYQRIPNWHIEHNDWIEAHSKMLWKRKLYPNTDNNSQYKNWCSICNSWIYEIKYLKNKQPLEILFSLEYLFKLMNAFC